MIKNLPIVFELAVELFNGDVNAAYRFLGKPNRSLFNNRSPLDELRCCGEKGLTRVKKLIGRTNHGIAF